MVPLIRLRFKISLKAGICCQKDSETWDDIAVPDLYHNNGRVFVDITYLFALKDKYR